MDGDMRPDPGAGIIWLIADTFDVPPGRITPATRQDEVSGWDSLGHSVLLTRVARKFNLDMTEELAAPVTDVGEFIGRIETLIRRPLHG